MIDVDVLMATILVPLLKMSSIIRRVLPACLVAYSIQRFLYNSNLYQAGHYEVYLIEKTVSIHHILYILLSNISLKSSF